MRKTKMEKKMAKKKMMMMNLHRTTKLINTYSRISSFSSSSNSNRSMRKTKKKMVIRLAKLKKELLTNRTMARTILLTMVRTMKTTMISPS